MSIKEVIERLNERAEVSIHGKAGTTAVVDKELLKQASIYLQDYLYCLGEESEG